MPTLATIAAFGFEKLPPDPLLQLYRELGCRSCQFYRNTANPPTVAEALAFSRDANLPFDSIHGVFGPEHDPASPDAHTRQRAIDTYAAEGELALKLGGPVVIVHPAPMVSSPPTPEALEFRYKPMMKSMEDLARLGEQLGVTYLVENLPPAFAFGNDPAQLASMIRKVDSSHLRMCLDTGHAHMTGSVAAAVAACADVIDYLHVSDNNSLLDAHQTPGEGTIAWQDVGLELAKLGPIPAMLELFHEPAALRALIDKGLGARLKPWLAVE